MLKSVVAGAVLAIAAGLFALAVLATSPKSRAESLAEWYKSLRQPITGMGCCDEADCSVTQARRDPDGHWQAMYAGQWVDVPPEKVIDDKGHPSGVAVLCATRFSIYCFVPPGAAG